MSSDTSSIKIVSPFKPNNFTDTLGAAYDIHPPDLQDNDMINSQRGSNNSSPDLYYSSKRCKLCKKMRALSYFPARKSNGKVVNSKICSYCRPMLSGGLSQKESYSSPEQQSRSAPLTIRKSYNRESCSLNTSPERDHVSAFSNYQPFTPPKQSVTLEDLYNQMLLSQMLLSQMNQMNQYIPAQQQQQQQQHQSPPQPPIPKNFNSKHSKNQDSVNADFTITFDELKNTVADPVYKGLKKDQYSQLTIYSNNPTEVFRLLPDPVVRKRTLVNELISFYETSQFEVVCQICHEHVQKLNCFIYHDKFLCKNCSMKVDSRELSDWSCNNRCFLFQCVRCKHNICYHKYLKYNRNDEIKRQNTCTYCRLKQWRDYYLGITPGI